MNLLSFLHLVEINFKFFLKSRSINMFLSKNVKPDKFMESRDSSSFEILARSYQKFFLLDSLRNSEKLSCVEKKN